MATTAQPSTKLPFPGGGRDSSLTKKPAQPDSSSTLD